MNERILRYLMQIGRIDHDTAVSVAGKIKTGQPLRELLGREAGLSEEEFTAAVSAAAGLPTVRLYEHEIPASLVRPFRADMLREARIMPFGEDPEDPGVLLAAVCDPLNIQGKDRLALASGKRIRLFLTTEQDILLSIDRCFGTPEMGEAARELSERADARYSIDDELAQEDVNNSPVVVLINDLLGQAVRRRASDIHIEATSERVRIRWRVDGILYEAASYSLSLHAAIVTRVKIMGGMDISEKRRPQDGRFSTETDGALYDVRVSTMPTVYGEKCVLRLQREKLRSRDKHELGMHEDEIRIFDRITHRSNGLVLVTGPTGSGKTTTLYTAVSELNSDQVNIVTVEDPVEANVEGVNQVQVNPKAGLTFSNALRSILRQDPDIIMIGEIRDHDTAEIAVQAAITGHLVVSTLHTNDTASSITRLQDLGVENYLIADAVVGIVAQRLVRRLCPRCKKGREPLPHERRYLGLSENDRNDVTIYEPAGCRWCADTGYFERIGVFEFMPISAVLRAMISEGRTADEIRAQASAEGMRTMYESARRLVLEGATSLREMRRITAFDAVGAEF